MINFIKKFKAARAEKKRKREQAGEADLLNEHYGGDWYFCEADQEYKDALTTRTATFNDGG